MKKILLLTLLVLINSSLTRAQIVINEVSSASDVNFLDEDGDMEDWIELYNSSNAAINLNGYKISRVENGDTNSWKFPSIIIKPYDHLTVYCSKKNRNIYFDHWEVPLYPQLNWKYFVGTVNPPSNWYTTGFNDGTWFSGPASIGYGDGDDATTTPPTMSVFMRSSFNITDTSKIVAGAFLTDFDDGFVAYLNGVEVARYNVGVQGDYPSNSVSAYDEHEAQFYQNGDLSGIFYFAPEIINSVKQPGTNVFAIQTHNFSGGTDDLTQLPYLLIGVNDTNVTYYPFAADVRLHTDFNLNSTGQTIILKNANGTIVDQELIGAMQMNDSRGRQTDGGTNWCLFDIASPDTTNNNSVCYTDYATAPVISLQSGFYPTNQTTSIASTTSGTIRYTTDGSDPTNFSLVYSNPISIGTNMSLRARVFPSNFNFLPSKIVTNNYFINENVTLPVVSLTSDPFNLFDNNFGIYMLGPNADSTNIPFYGANFWNEWDRPANIEFFDKQKVFRFETDASIKIQGNWSKAWPQRGFTIRTKDNYGGTDINYTMFPDKPQVNKLKAFNVRNAGSDWNTGHIRDRFNHKTIKKTHVDIMDAEPCLLFINGQYWGVYELRERQDKNYIEENTGIDADKIDLLSFDGSVIEGTNAAFINMATFMYTNNMTLAPNYDSAKAMLDIENFCDYFISETHIVNIDWLGSYTNNIKYWRPNNPPGKWRYIFWDTDVSLGLASFFDGADTTNMLLRAIMPPTWNPHSAMLYALLQNTEFRYYFINRYADLLNTIFHPVNRQKLLYALRDEVAPEMTRHFNRWGNQFNWSGIVGQSNNVPQWMSELGEIEQFDINRQAISRNHIESIFQLIEQVDVTLQTLPANAGIIQINTIIPDSFPWTGVYFDGAPVTMTATAKPGYKFSHWQSNTVQPSAYTNVSLTVNVDNDDTFTAYYLPLEYRMDVFPNPFSDDVTINFELPAEAQIAITLFDVIGNKITDIVSNTQFTGMGQHSVKFNANAYSLASGMYFIKINAGDYSKTVEIIKTDE